jgi:hypothetical protein
MTKNISREALYELIWSKPMTHVAKDLGISDVMLGKMCKEQLVPKPPRGYWANLGSDKKRVVYVRPKLPDLFQKKNDFNQWVLDDYKLRESLRTDKFDPDDLSDPVREPPPPFMETLPQFRERMSGVMPVLPNMEALKVMHPLIRTINEADLQLEEAHKKDRWAPSPQFRTLQGRQQLRLFNVFVSCFQVLGFEPSVRGRKYLVFSARVFDQPKKFNVFLKNYNPSAAEMRRFKTTKRTTYCFAWTEDDEEVTRSKNYYEFEELSAETVKTVVLDLLAKREEMYRRSVFFEYSYNLRARNEAIEIKQRRAEKLFELREQAKVQLMETRTKLLRQAVERMQYADQIRNLINAVKDKAIDQGNPSELGQWAAWAVEQADAIDPRAQSLEDTGTWISQFKLEFKASL